MAITPPAKGSNRKLYQNRTGFIVIPKDSSGAIVKSCFSKRKTLILEFTIFTREHFFSGL